VSRQYFAEVLAPIMQADQTAVPGTSEAALWPVQPWTAMVANQLQPGQVYRLTATGVLTTAGATPGTLTITPRWQASGVAGTSFGASAASPTLATSQTNLPWWLEAFLQCRTIGTSGTAVLTGYFLTTPASSIVSPLLFGGPSTTIDTTTAQGIGIDVTLGAAGDTMTTRCVVLEALN
jgi:hypothetical protein